MKKLLNFPILCLFGLGMLFTSCGDTETIGDTFADEQYSNGGGVALVEFADVTGDSWIIPAGDESVVGFDIIDPTESATSGDLLLSLSGGTPIVFKTITAFPDTVSLRISDIATAFGITADDLTGDDVLTMTLDATTSSGVWRSSSVLAVPFIDCPSEINGDLSYKSYDHFCFADSPDTLIGTVTLDKVSGIEFAFSDWAFGSYEVCYGGPAANWGDLRIRDLCGTVTTLGVDNYGDGWLLTVQGQSGPTLTVKWENDYGEAGTVELTRDDGTDWPPLSN